MPQLLLAGQRQLAVEILTVIRATRANNDEEVTRLLAGLAHVRPYQAQL